jgi:hypothetical protein
MYDDDTDRVEFGEIHLFVGPSFVITLRRRDRPDLSAIRDALELEPTFLGNGPEAMLTTLLDEIVDGYAPVVAGLEEDIDQVDGAGPSPTSCLSSRTARCGACPVPCSPLPTLTHTAVFGGVPIEMR